MPDAYRPGSKSDQPRGDLAQQRTGILDDEEMSAVYSTYTACSEAQDSPPSAQDMYRLVASMAVDAMSRSNEHADIANQKANVVRCMDRYIRETTLELNVARRELSSRTDDNRLFRFHAHMGDYAGALCDAIKEPVNKHSSSILSQPWTMIVGAIDKFEKELADWQASGQHGMSPHSVHLDTIKRRVQQLSDLGFTNLDIDTALFAIRSYARRNFISHERAFNLYMKEDFVGLAKYLDHVDKTLDDVLPDEEKSMTDMWRSLLTFYRHSHIRKNEKGDWVRQIPLKILARSPSPLSRSWGAALRTEIEMGKYRPIGSDGPPPTNVLWDPSTFRRQSEPELRGLKRPATEQSTEQSQVKKIRVANYTDRSLETVQAITDSDAQGHQKLQLKLHNLSCKLAQYSPKEASQLLQKHVEQQQCALIQLKEKIRKKQRARWEKNQHRPQE